MKKITSLKSLLSVCVFFLMLLPKTGQAQADKEHYFSPIVSTSSDGTFKISNTYYYIANPNNVPAVVSVFYSTADTVFSPVTIPPNSSTVIEIPGTGDANPLSPNTSTTNENGKVLSSRGVRISSTEPVIVAVKVKNSSNVQAGHLVSKGLNGLGKIFRIATVPHISGIVKGDRHSSFFSLYATKATTVTIKFPAGYTDIGDGVSDGNGGYTYSLSARQTLYFVDKGVDNDDQSYDQLIGTLVEATEDITVNVGTITGAPKIAGQDFSIDQIVPVEAIGTEYVISRVTDDDSSAKDEPQEIPFVVAHTNNTSVYINGYSDPIAILQAGEYIAITGNYGATHGGKTTAGSNGDTAYTNFGSMYIRTSNPAYVYQAMTSKEGPQVGMFFVPPLICSAPRSTTIPFINKVGDVDFPAGMNIVTRSIAELKINTVSLSDLLAGGYVLNYGGNNINGRPITGLTQNLTTYQLTIPNEANFNTYIENNATTPYDVANAIENLFIESTTDLYLAGFGASGSAGHGGYYSGFAPSFEIKTDEEDLCFPTTLKGPDDFNYYQWYRNNVEITGATSQNYLAQESVVGTYTYTLKVGFTGCDPLSSINSKTITAIAQPTSSLTKKQYCSLDFANTSTTPTIGKLEGVDGVGLGLPQPTPAGETIAANIKWYGLNPTTTVPDPSASPDPNPELPRTTALDNATKKYYVIYAPNASSCTSSVPLEITVEVKSPTAAPTYTTTDVNSVVFCGDTAPLISNLTAENILKLPTASDATSIVWFENDYDSTNPDEEFLPGSTPLISGTYYGASYNDGVCSYTNRLPVRVHVEGPLEYNVQPKNTIACKNVDVLLNAELFNTGISKDNLETAETADADTAAATSNGAVEVVWEYSIDNGATYSTIPTPAPAAGGNPRVFGGTVTSSDLSGSSPKTEISLEGEFIAANDTAAAVNSFTPLYRVKSSIGGFSGGCSQVLISSAVRISSSVITINTQPLPTTACVGDVVELKTLASATFGTVSYIWQQRTVNATNGAEDNWALVGSGKSLIVTTTTGTNKLEYRAIVSNQYCDLDTKDIDGVDDTAVRSNTVKITVDGPIGFEQSIENALVCAKEDAVFTAVIDTGDTNATPTIAWFVDKNDTNGFVAVGTSDGTAAYNATTKKATFTVTTAATDHLNKYQARVTSTKCTSPVVSTATLRVENIAGKSTVSVTPSDLLVCAGGLLNFKATPNANNVGDVNYTWQESATGAFGGEETTVGSGASLLLSNVQANKDKYYYRVLTGTTLCSADPLKASTKVQIRVTGPLQVTTELVNQTLCLGMPLSLTVGVDAGYQDPAATATSDDLIYTWKKKSTTDTDFVNIVGADTVEGDATGLGKATLSLSETAVKVNGNSTLYRVLINSGKCASPVSSSALITLEGAISYTATDANQPKNITACAGETVNFSANAVIDPTSNTGSLSYIWETRENATSTWSTIGTGPTLVVANVTAAQNGRQYRQVATTQKCARVESSIATLTVDGPISIDTPLVDAVICDSNSATFTVVASAPNGTLGFVWKRNGMAITSGGDFTIASTATGSTLTVSGPTATATNNNDVYTVEVNTSVAKCDAIVSSAKLKVEGPVVATNDFSAIDNIATCTGTDVTFDATGRFTTGAGTAIYQWQFKGNGATSFTSLSGKTDPELKILNVQNADVGDYRVVITTNACNAAAPDNSFTSGNIKLSIAGLVEISDDLDDLTACLTRNTADTGYETAAGALKFQATTTGTSYTWEKSTNGGNTYVAVTAGETSDGVINTNTLTLKPVVDLDADTSDDGAISAANNTLYRVTVAAGGCNGTALQSTARLTIEGPLVITEDPVSQTVCSGETVILETTARPLTGSGTLMYTWQVDLASTAAVGDWIQISSGNRLILSNVNSSQNGNKYRVVLSSGTSCTPVNSAEATLNVEGPLSLITGLEDQVVCQEVSGTSAVANFSVNVNAGTGTKKYLWERFDTSANNWVAVLASETVGGNNSGNTLDFASLALNVTAADDDTLYRVSVTTTKCTVPVRSTARLDVEGPITENFSTINDPVICAGDSMILTVTASAASGKLTYLWEESTDGTTFSAVGTSATFVKPSVKASDNGNKYRISIGTTLEKCTVKKKTFTLTVDGPIEITDAIDDITLCDDGNASTNEIATFTVAATTGASTVKYLWEFAESTASTTFNPVLAGETSDGVINAAVLNVKASSAQNGNIYRVSVTTTAGVCSAKNSSATLKVEGPITIGTQPVNTVVCAGSPVEFSVDASVATNGGDLTYLWQESAIGDFTDARTVAIGKLYIIGNAQSSKNGYKYRAVVRTEFCEVISNVAVLTVDGAIQITDVLDDVSLCDDGNSATSETATYTVGASLPSTATGTLQYKWEVASSNNPSSFGPIPAGNIVSGGGITDNKIEVSISSVDNGNIYQVSVTTTDAMCSAKTSSATLKVEGPITINTQPANISVCAGSPAEFTIAASVPTNGGDLSYLWQESASGDFTDAKTVGSGTLYVIGNAQASKNGYSYRAIVKTGLCEVISNKAVLTVNGPVVITKGLDNALLCDDGSGSLTHTFNVSATVGASIPFYKWEVDKGSGFTTIAGAKSASLTVSYDVSNNKEIYRVSVGADSCDVLTSQAILSVEGPIEITKQPEDIRTCEGKTATFSVKAEGNGTAMSYNWEESKNEGSTWTTVANTATYVKSGIVLDDHQNKYRVTVFSSACTGKTSNEVTLVVQGAPVIDSNPEDQTLAVGSNVNITTVVSNISTFGNYTYQWQINTSDGNGWSNLTETAQYSGTKTIALTINDAPYELTGNRYRIIIETVDCGIRSISKSMMLTLDYDCDNDGILNSKDDDDDNDGIIDTIENKGKDVFGDDDNDKVRNFQDADYCTLNALGVCESLDADGDGMINQCDSDADGNGIDDGKEAGGLLANPVDTDSDGVADYLDLDNDNNGISDIAEIGANSSEPIDTDSDGVADYNDLDNDGDNISDIYEIGSDTSNPLNSDDDSTADYLDVDSDNDGLLDSYEAGDDASNPVDTDKDQLEDYRDKDSDGNGITDTVESGDSSDPIDTDNDGTPDHLDFDNDNDSLSDKYELGLLVYNQDTRTFVANPDNTAGTPLVIDSDEDGTQNYLDNDDDNDGIVTIEEDGNDNGFLLDAILDDCDRDKVFDYLDKDACDDLIFPNGFTPNGDGLHEKFVVPFLYNYPNFTMEIVDRNGNLVYKYTDDGNSATEPEWWDGTNKGGGKIMPAATYFYRVDFNKSERPSKTGWIYLRK